MSTLISWKGLGPENLPEPYGKIVARWAKWEKEIVRPCSLYGNQRWRCVWADGYRPNAPASSPPKLSNYVVFAAVKALIANHLFKKPKATDDQLRAS
jgi:hypothetical protein